MEDIKTKADSLIGIVLVGGKSKRMGQSKALIKFQGKRLFERTATLLKACTEKIYISGKSEQLKLLEIEEDLFIPDTYHDIGPLAGILSAFNFQDNRNNALLVCATDLPFLDQQTLSLLVEKRDTSKLATMFRHPDTSYLEPLCAIYEKCAFPFIQNEVEKGNYAIHRILNDKHVNLIDIPEKKALFNINYPDQLKDLDQN